MLFLRGISPLLYIAFISNRKVYIVVVVLYNMVKMKCSNEKCEHEWEYKGKSKIYATCPFCKKSIKTNKNDKQK